MSGRCGGDSFERDVSSTASHGTFVYGIKDSAVPRSISTLISFSRSELSRKPRARSDFWSVPEQHERYGGEERRNKPEKSGSPVIVQFIIHLVRSNEVKYM